MLYFITGIIIIIYLGKFVREIKLTRNIRELEKMGKVSQMLSEEKFWSIIDQSLLNSKNQSAQEESLLSILNTLTLRDIVGFRLRTDKLLYDTYNSEIWCAGYIMNSGCSDDEFEYFRCWIMSRGREVFSKAKKDPDSLVYISGDISRPYEFENFWYVALKAFNKKTGKNLYDYIDYDNFLTREGKYPEIKFSWRGEDLDSMRKICPKLFKRFID